MESEGSGGSEGDKRKGAFNIPSVSEIKRANRVPVVTSAPAIFRQQHHRPLDTNQEGVAAAPKPRPTTITDAAAGEGSRDPVREGDSASTKLSSADRVGRKRTREGLDSPKQIVSTKSTVIVTNERVVLQQGSDKTPAAASTAVSGATGVTGGERSFVASSDGVGASVTASTSAPAHHPHAIITNPVQVCVNCVCIYRSVCVCVQKKNPVIKHIRNVPWELGDIVPDFVLGKTTCAMFLRSEIQFLTLKYTVQPLISDIQSLKSATHFTHYTSLVQCKVPLSPSELHPLSSEGAGETVPAENPPHSR